MNLSYLMVIERASIPKKIKNYVFLYSRHECCLCDKKVSGKYESNIHHINNDPSDNNIDNLILLCPNCHSIVTRGDYKPNDLIIIRDAKYKTIGIKDFLEDKEGPELSFETKFNLKLDKLLTNLEEKGNYIETNDLIDDIIMIVKTEIEKWNVPSVRYATKNLFLKLYPYNKKNYLSELYYIFEDLFLYAYRQRKHILGTMINVFNIILFSSWVPDYDIEKGEEASKILLRLGIDFLNIDLEVTNDCLTAIDNLAGDMFEPEILSKEILLTAAAFNELNKSSELIDFIEKAAYWIQVNDEYSWEGDTSSYLIDSIKYAESEQSEYNMSIESLKQEYLIPLLNETIDKNIKDFIDYMDELKNDGEFSYHTMNLTKMIYTYYPVRPTIMKDIDRLVYSDKDEITIKNYNNIKHSNNYLQRMYTGNDMIVNFNELLEFFKRNFEQDSNQIGITTWGSSWILFERKINKKEINLLVNLSYKYNIRTDFEISDYEISFLMDDLVYIDKKNDMTRLIEFLDELNSILPIKKISTGINFKLQPKPI